MIDFILLKLPIFGTLLNKVAVAKFTRTLGTLVSSGVPILDGLEITAKTSGNKVVEYAIMGVRKEVVGGKTIAEPIKKAKVFPPMVTHMIAVGESTGALDAMLGKIADFYDDEVDAAVTNLTAMMEPLLMVFLGTTVGFIVVAMYLPIFKLITLIK
jgi:type IV pilus assembly protein PilC